MRRPLAGLLLPLLLLTVTACGRSDPAPEPEPPAPFADCAALTTVPSAAPADTGGRPDGSTRPLPDVGLPCFTGGAEVSLAAVRGPAVVNLWAAWCLPCRKELPAFQRLAERAGGQLHVVGVDTRDDRDDARDLAGELGLTFPTLFDPGEKLRSGVAAPGLPATVFVDAQGRIRHLDVTGALDDNKLAALVEQHLGVVVPA
ncbi:TlpA family protein disulfide reductase [Micromonospora sp. NBC_01796]|uniref:TlpA family protein disulfide reductase n=1 Tax=Micromonospora sp. NBC_01796 TaxID=2975987 RepID=UPI002DD8476A|nr:TlpA disulfide reductase family protein [Micromonospora sp. NBC_01796]WSA88288.1 TlpA family protein disulfide reductase [Micromonospora sp. NBC_01796]